MRTGHILRGTAGIGSERPVTCTNRVKAGRDRLIAIIAVIAVLSVPIGTAYSIGETDDNGFLPAVPFIYAALAATGTFFVGLEVGYILWADSATDADDYMRLMAVNGITDKVSVAKAFAANANANYAQLWGMTKEHWIRQTELESYNQWREDADFSASSVLEGSLELQNAAIMTANAVAQINSFMDSLSDSISDVRDSDTYGGKIHTGFRVDHLSRDTVSDWDADLLTLMDLSEGNRIYIDSVDSQYVISETSDYGPGHLYNLGPSMEIVSEDGKRYLIPSGKTDLESLRSMDTSNTPFRSGIYTVSSPGTVAGDSIISLTGNESVSMYPALVFQCGTDTEYVYYAGSSLKYKGVTHQDVYLYAYADDIPNGQDNPAPVRMNPVLQAYGMLLDKICWVCSNSVSSAYAVWSIYTQANERDYNVTTLMANNVYDSVVLSEQMNEIMTISAMQQLASFYDSNKDNLSDLRISLYSDGMDAPFVRGSIIDTFGNTVYDDVIFTPFFQSEDVLLSTSEDYTIGQSCIIAVWSDGQHLGQWYSDGMDTDGYTTLFVSDGYVLSVSELGSCHRDPETGSVVMENKTALEFKVSKIDYIQPEDVPIVPLPDYTKTSGWFQTVCIVLGAVVSLYGLVRREPLFLVLGIAAVVFGALFAQDVWDSAEKWMKLRGLMP